MQINEFARTILLGTTLEDKLVDVAVAEDARAAAPLDTPLFPGRPASLSRLGNSKFPSTHALKDATTRGHVLHFFANHELLAMELMALVLLKFPEAPLAFRMGLVRTIQEEQSHMRLYIERMQELGVEFGDLPLSDYFWNCLKNMRSPLEFVTQMSLTFEQANLDYSLYYRDQIASFGDEKTAAILDRVYREEIGHVKHGLAWFNRWRENAEESDWDAYKRLLPLPLTPRRAKGIEFSADARRAAGLSETFIRELEINAGSKGRPPIVWVYNPSCDAEIARGQSGFSAPQMVQRVSQDLEPLLLTLARDGDMIWTKERPRLEWLKTMSDAGFEIPEFVDSQEIREPRFGGFEPWGWSPSVFEKFHPLKDRLIETKEGLAAWNRSLFAKRNFQETGLGKFFSKSWSSEFLYNWLKAHPETHEILGPLEIAGTSIESYDKALAKIKALLTQGQTVVVKAPFGTSGNQVKRVSSRKDIEEGTLPGWIKNTIKAQHAVVIEPWLDKLHDLSIQIEVGEQVRLLEVREFITDQLWQYQGTLLGKKFWRFTPDELRFFNQALPAWHRLARDIGHALREGGYRGPAGIDALIWKTPDQQLRLKPIIELNPRWTMGRVALALEDHLVPGVRAAWMIRKKAAVDFALFEKTHPAKFFDGENGRRLESGVWATTDFQTAREVVTFLAVGDEALASLLK